MIQTINPIDYSWWIDQMFYPTTSLSVSASHQMQCIERWMGHRHQWYVITESIDPQFADYYQQHNAPWVHSGNDHNTLGMAWAWRVKQLGMTIELSDSPDIRGTWRCSDISSSVIGDVGRASYMAWLDGMWGRTTRQGDVWISVIDWNRVVMIEFMYDMGAAMRGATI